MDQLFDLQKIIKLRHELHQNPELSDHEINTSKRIVEFVKQYKPDSIIENVGGYGVVCVFKGKEDGASVLFRCDIDALPINELNDVEYKSKVKGVSHKCGHDGHMAIMAGFAEVLSKNPIQKGQVVLLFQSSEENGQGAFRVLNNNKFKNIKIDYAFALHNLPGFSKGEVILRNETFASASKGIVIKFLGKTSHAAEPENGISPAVAMVDIVKQLNDLPKRTDLFSDFTLVTVVYARLGEIAFGTSPGDAVVMATLRSYTNDDMDILTQKAEFIAKQISESHHLKCEISFAEEFPATVNNEYLVKKIEEVAKSNHINFQYLEKPFRWSEDFAHFTQKYPGVLLGLGSGENHPQLHNPDYDFPDEIIENGVKMFYEIYKQIIKIP